MIDNTGATDVTAQITAAIEATPDGSTYTLPPGTYRCETTVRVEGRTGLTIHAPGAALLRTETGIRGTEHLRIEDSTGSIVRGLSVLGCNPIPGRYNGPLEGQHAYSVYRSHGTLFELCRATNTYADGVYVAADSSWVHVNKCTLTGMARHGVCVVDGKMVGVTGSTIAGVGFSSVDLEPNAPQLHVWGVLVKDNCFIGGRLIWLTGAGTSQVDVVTADGNALTANKAMGVHCYSNHGVRRVGWTITNNWSNKIAGAASETCMTFRGVDGLIITGNTQPMAKGRNMVLATVEDCTDFDISDNDLSPYAVGQYRTLP